MPVDILNLADRPDLLDPVASWLWREWGEPDARTLAQVTSGIAGRRSRRGPEQTLVLLEDGTLAGTASLVHHDLHERQDLTPWLASVYVDPARRGRGYAVRLVRAIEQAAAATTDTLWLQTWTAPGLYARLGWYPAGSGTDQGHAVTIMRRDLPRTLV